jgi:hypothetical protein
VPNTIPAISVLILDLLFLGETTSAFCLSMPDKKAAAAGI